MIPKLIKLLPTLHSYLIIIDIDRSINNTKKICRLLKKQVIKETKKNKSVKGSILCRFNQ